MYTQKIYYKEYKEYWKIYIDYRSAGNDKLLVLIPWQTLPACMFFDFPVFSDNSPIIDKFIVAGYDVVMVDMVGYGASEWIVFPLYTRQHIAEQIVLVVNDFRNTYKKVILQAFCSTTHGPIIAAKEVKIDGIVLLWPVFPNIQKEFTIKYLKEKKQNISITNQYTQSNFQDFLVERFEKISDLLVDTPLRIENWNEKFLDRLNKIPTFHEKWKWYGVKDMIQDIRIYSSLYKWEWWTSNDINCNFILMRWEFDYECSEYYLNKVVHAIWKERCIIKTIPQSTHFWMWEKNHILWTKEFIDWINNF